ncbi:MAG: ATP-dependent DNA helicase [Abditibacteriaceae bacterium]
MPKQFPPHESTFNDTLPNSPDRLPLAAEGEFGDVVDSFFAPDGMLARSLGSNKRQYEERPQQQAMAREVTDAIETQSHLMVEAGTGTGKSYAYLVPFILWALHENKRVLISTHTKTLQQQLVEKDLPFLQRLFEERLGLNFNFALCLGTQNYICPRRLAKYDSVGLFAAPDEAHELENIQEYARHTKEGHLLDLPFEPRNQLWSQINRESDLCLGKGCSLYEKSFYYMARNKQENAQILVSNHHLLFAHLAAGGNEAGVILPRFDAVVVDEAHQIEEVATAYLGDEISNYSVGKLLNRLLPSGNVRNVLSGSKLRGQKNLEEQFAGAVIAAKEANGRFFDNLLMTMHLSEDATMTRRLTSPLPLANDLSEPLGQLELLLMRFKRMVEDDDDGSARELEGYAGRCGTLKSTLDVLLHQKQKDWVYWMQLQQRSLGSSGAPRIALCGAPIDIGDALNEMLFSKIKPVVMASATLTTAGTFDYLQNRLGLKSQPLNGESSKDGVTPQTALHTTILGSPFDYAKQALVYLPSRMPNPTNGNDSYDIAAAQAAAEILPLQKGGAFVLCTSHRSVQQIANSLTEILPSSFTVMRQGEASRSRLLENFQTEKHPVLVGTTSFWQGIDIPGQTLSCVIIVKLPFASPRDPMVEARTEFLEKNGKNGFMEYQVPQAVMMFRQGFGRLIRSATDHGIVAILDPRVRTRPYGSLFLESLPDCKVTQKIDDVTQFLSEKP